MPDCVFCGIASGAIPSIGLHRDERTLAFMDIQPVNPGHLLVVPLRHAAALAELDTADAEAMMGAGRRLAAALRAAGTVRCEGVNLWLADGRAAGQEVFHVHLHVIPRFEGDGFGLRFGPDYGKKPESAELDRLARSIRGALGMD